MHHDFRNHRGDHARRAPVWYQCKRSVRRGEVPSVDGSDQGGSCGAVLEGHSIEVKRASSYTLNQVRAVKYIPLVVFHEPTTTWYVVPAHVVVVLVSTKNRGQHTENPFESATLNVGHLGAYRVEEAALKQRTLDAIAESANVPALRDEMVRVLTRSRDLAAESLTSVRKVVKDLGLARGLPKDP